MDVYAQSDISSYAHSIIPALSKTVKAAEAQYYGSQAPLLDTHQLRHKTMSAGFDGEHTTALNKIFMGSQGNNNSFMSLENAVVDAVSEAEFKGKYGKLAKFGPRGACKSFTGDNSVKKFAVSSKLNYIDVAADFSKTSEKGYSDAGMKARADEKIVSPLGMKYVRFAVHRGVIRPNLTIDLLVLCGPSIAAQKLIESFRRRTSLPASLVMGYDRSKKKYSTSKLKTYPAPFCHALASLGNRWAHEYVQNDRDLTWVPMEQFQRYTVELQRNFNYDATRGADHHWSDLFN